MLDSLFDLTSLRNKLEPRNVHNALAEVYVGAQIAPVQLAKHLRESESSNILHRESTVYDISFHRPYARKTTRLGW
jgi:hypothetical protein